MQANIHIQLIPRCCASPLAAAGVGASGVDGGVSEALSDQPERLWATEAGHTEAGVSAQPGSYTAKDLPAGRDGRDMWHQVMHWNNNDWSKWNRIDRKTRGLKSASLSQGYC